MFFEDTRRVVLIRKNRPAWMKGRLNGVGGSIEDNESPAEAMAREFKEETGVHTLPDDWNVFCRLTSTHDTELFFFSCLMPADPGIRTTTDEIVGDYPIAAIQADCTLEGRNMLPNMPYLILMGWYNATYQSLNVSVVEGKHR